MIVIRPLCRAALLFQKHRVLATGLALLMCWLGSCAAEAQIRDERANADTGGVTVEAVAGWDGAVDRSMPIPVALEVGNFSGKDIDGSLLLTDPSGGHEAILGDIYIAQGSTRTFSSIQDLSSWQECYITLRQGREIIWRRELPLSTGVAFDNTTNFAILIEPEGRRLTLSGDDKTEVTANPTTGVAGAAGRKVVCLTARTWQIPRHPGPLTGIQAMIFADGIDVDALNTVQLEAVAQWMCQGGVIFVRDTAHELIDRLIGAAPLNVADPGSSQPFTVRPVGLGALYEYNDELLHSDSSDQQRHIARIIRTLPQIQAGSLLPKVPSYYRSSGNADYNRFLVLTFFGIYTLFSGLVSLLLFRQSRRRVATYTVTVVLLASVLAGVLGVVLRRSPGDLQIQSVTHAGAGGIVQVARVEVQSAGSRSTQVAVSGPRADLQMCAVESDLFHYGYAGSYGNSGPDNHPPFTWQPSDAKDIADLYEIGVALTPWGTRQLRAAAFEADVPPCNIHLSFESTNADTDEAVENAVQIDPSGYYGQDELTRLLPMPQGQLSVEVENNTPFDFSGAILFVGTTVQWERGDDEEDSAVNPAGPHGQRMSEFLSPSGQVDVYHIQRLDKIQPGKTLQRTFQSRFEVKHYWNMQESIGDAQIQIPRISRLGIAEAWLVARLDESPLLKIDEGRTQFVPSQQAHFYVQKISQAEIANNDQLLPLPATEESP